MLPGRSLRPLARFLGTRRADYLPPAATVDAVDLTIRINAADDVVVSGDLTMRAQLQFHCDSSVDVVSINGEQDTTSITRANNMLTTMSPPFTMNMVARVNPRANTSCMGLYESNGLLVTQMEADGFRRLFPCVDRPDNLALYKVRIEADQTVYPVLLSNGNVVEEGLLADNRHFVIFDDPFKKPTYLFAVAAGDLHHVTKTFTTRSGRAVAVKVFSTRENVSTKQLDFALESVLKSMKFDEDAFGLEYDLDVFNVVAVADFNAGAMENKSLNVFNVKLLVGSIESSTDAELNYIDAVVAHEYFHNWTGNRVTVRDWFQLTLKEGLTVFRDQTYSEEVGLFGALSRIDSVVTLLASQFPQDSGPKKHPIRPEVYHDMNTELYTPTVYEKGAEIIRMYQTILGKEGFRKGFDLYIERGDGKAMTCDDFLQAMEDATGVDLSLFAKWYSTAGTPTVTQKGEWQDDKYRVTFARNDDLGDLHIPIHMGLIDRNTGKELAAQLIELKSNRRSALFDIPKDSEPVISSFRHLSAPVNVPEQSLDDLLTLAAHDTDVVNRWMAVRQLHTKAIFDLIDKKEVPTAYLDALRSILESSDDGFTARALEMPSFGELLNKRACDPLVLDDMIQKLKATIKDHLKADLHAKYDSIDAHATEHVLDQKAAFGRALSNRCVDLLKDSDLTEKQFENATKYTLRHAAFAFLLKQRGHGPWIDAFYAQCNGNPNVLDSFFLLQAAALPLDDVRSLLKHEDFSFVKPNRVRGLFRGFVRNVKEFHRKDGSGYAFVTHIIQQVDTTNHDVACQVLDGFEAYRKWGPNAAIARSALEALQSTPGLSENLAHKLGEFLKQ
eukprot:GEMP01006730.1.p1 GENE.GEMP01006730.1~~GEMP01006730.1.p1  ORF type:complete len:858 (+),score=220.49 GEMP01006730.1:52-2574(+)